MLVCFLVQRLTPPSRVHCKHPAQSCGCGSLQIGFIWNQMQLWIQAELLAAQYVDTSWTPKVFAGMSLEWHTVGLSPWMHQFIFQVMKAMLIIESKNHRQLLRKANRLLWFHVPCVRVVSCLNLNKKVKKQISKLLFFFFFLSLHQQNHRSH